MDWLRIDEWWEMLVVGLIAGGVVLGALAMILRFLQRGGKVKVGKVSVTDTKYDDRQPDRRKVDVCVGIPEHSELFVKLAEAIEELKVIAKDQAASTRGIDAMQRAQSVAIDVLLGLSEGDEKNGQVAKARLSLAEASGFKKAIEPS